MARSPNPDYLVLDIETIPDTDRWQRPPGPDPNAPPGTPPPRPQGDAFPPTWAQRIVVAGALWLDAEYRFVRLALIGAGAAGSADDKERALLRELSDHIDAHRPILVTYNGRGFDLPVIALRSLCHAIPMAWYYRDRNVRYRYSDDGHLDLCDWLADHGAARAGKLDALARLLGLPGKLGIDGSQVEPLWLDGRHDEVERYCLSDVAQTAFLLLRFRLLQGRLGPDDYRARVDALAQALAADPRVTDVIAKANRDQLLGA